MIFALSKTDSENQPMLFLYLLAIKEQKQLKIPISLTARNFHIFYYLFLMVFFLMEFLNK